MPPSRTPWYIGSAAAAGLAYYLYKAGGDPRAARKKFESDAHHVSAEAKQHLPGNKSNVEKEMGRYGAKAGEVVDDAVARANQQADSARSTVKGWAKDVQADAIKGADKVEEGAKQAKSNISGWFGGK